MGLFSKLTDPLGVKKKARKAVGIKVDPMDPFGHIGKAEDKLKDVIGYDFEKFHFKSMWDDIRKNPMRALYGSFDPISTKMWNKILGTDYDPIINQMGGATSQRFQDYVDAGGDPRAAKKAAQAHQVASTIASIYGGGALGSVAGAGAQGLGATVTPAMQTAITGATKAAVPALTSEADALFPVEYIDQNPGLANYDVMRGLRGFSIPTYGYRGYGGSKGGKVMTYSKGGRAEFKKGKEMTEQIGSLAQVPGALEMLVTIAAEELGGPKGGKSKQLRLYNMGGAVKGYQQGGLGQVMEQQAEEVRQAGRGDDEMLLHLAPEEYEAITSMWGEPDINPTTGVPEYGFLSKLWKGIKKTVKKIVKSPLFSLIAPIALNVFAPGLGSAIGGWLGATGKAAATIGNTVLRTGIGAVSGGKTGAISGALSGLTMSGVGADIGKKIGLSGATAEIAGDALLGGVAGEASGVGFGAGATGQAISSMMGKPMQRIERKLTDVGKDIFNPMGGGMKGEFDVTPGSMSIGEQQDPFGYGSELLPQTVAGDPGDISGLGSGLTPGAVLSGGAPQADPSWWDRSKDWMKEHPWLTAGGALGIAGMAGAFDGGGYDEGPPDFSQNLPPGFNDPLPNLSFDRTQLPAADYFTYGRASGPQAGEASFFEPNVIPSTTPVPVGSTGGVGGPGIGGMGGLQPFTVSGPMDMMKVASLVNQQGWTYDEATKTAYPPGSFGPLTAQVALGGLVQKYQTGGHVRGPGTGRSDDIPAVLSDGEYVIDSESVALLGDGSTDAGARRLDDMRKNLRSHKGKKLAKGGFSDKAKEPEKYMAEGGGVESSAGKSALRNLKRLANKLEQAITSGNKKRVNEITSQLKSLDGGNKVITGLAKGGSVKRILAALERAAESESTSAVGPVEKRMRARRKTGRKGGRRMSDKEKAELLEELGGFKKDSKFIRRFRKDLKEAKKEEGK